MRGIRTKLAEHGRAQLLLQQRIVENETLIQDLGIELTRLTGEVLDLKRQQQGRQATSPETGTTITEAFDTDEEDQEPSSPTVQRVRTQDLKFDGDRRVVCPACLGTITVKWGGRVQYGNLRTHFQRKHSHIVLE
ncbi:hypothetical protein HDE_02618 [Halotydeus destructor]|nr:hypothetical protein HDE_02618 [Halotydeus destructor]